MVFMLKKHILPLFLLNLILTSCINPKESGHLDPIPDSQLENVGEDIEEVRNLNIHIKDLGFDYLRIEKQYMKDNGFNGFAIYTNCNKYEYSDIESLYIIGYIPEHVFKQWGGPVTFSHDLKLKNNGLNEECILSFFADYLDEQDIDEIIDLMKNIKIELIVNEKIVETKYIEIQSS